MGGGRFRSMAGANALVAEGTSAAPLFRSRATTTRWERAHGKYTNGQNSSDNLKTDRTRISARTMLQIVRQYINLINSAQLLFAPQPNTTNGGHPLTSVQPQTRLSGR